MLNRLYRRVLGTISVLVRSAGVLTLSMSFAMPWSAIVPAVCATDEAQLESCCIDPAAGAAKGHACCVGVVEPDPQPGLAIEEVPDSAPGCGLCQAALNMARSSRSATAGLAVLSTPEYRPLPETFVSEPATWNPASLRGPPASV